VVGVVYDSIHVRLTAKLVSGLQMSEKLTLSELFALFGRTSDDTRWVGSADSEEYLAVVTYLVQRSSAR
jgi:hypothetical protein